MSVLLSSTSFITKSPTNNPVQNINASTILKQKNKALRCDICGEKYKLPQLLRHYYLKHKIKISLSPKNHSVVRKYKCRICETMFTEISNRRRHEKRFHNYNPPLNYNVNCVKCNYICKSKTELQQHILENHKDLQKPEELVFSTYLEFEKWKDKIEKDTVSSYVLAASREEKSYIRQSYYCHRSGYYKPTGKNIRNIKLGGSNKIGSVCPAGIITRIYTKSGNVTVKYFPVHFGHDFDVGRLRLTKTEKQEIAKQLQAGLSAQSILNNIAETASPSTRFAETKWQDVRNVSLCYGLDMNATQSKEDVESVTSWVKKMMIKDYNPILLYKVSGTYNMKYPNLEEDDFVLGYMNNPQNDIFQLHGSDVLLIDSVQDFNKNEIQLTSIIVKGDNHQAFPVALLWSNRQSEDIFVYFFEMIKTQIGNLQVNAFLSDDDPVYYNAWCRVFDPPVFDFLCDWHVKKTWMKQLCSGSTKITNLEKRRKIMDKLDLLINEIDEGTFQELLKEMDKMLLNNPETINFGNDFRSKYLNRSRQWATCYRVSANIDTNMDIEKLHKNIKYNSNSKGISEEQLDKAIHSLMKLLQIKTTNRLTSHRGKVTKIIRLIKNTHQMAVEAEHEISVSKQDDETWLVSSTLQTEEMYTVKKLTVTPRHKCNLICEACNICFHQLSCNCSNSAIECSMCQHMHIIGIKESSIEGDNFDDITTNSDYEFNNNVLSETSTIFTENVTDASLSQFKEKAKSEVINMISKIENFNTIEQCKELITFMSFAKLKCETLKSS